METKSPIKLLPHTKTQLCIPEFVISKQGAHSLDRLKSHIALHGVS